MEGRECGGEGLSARLSGGVREGGSNVSDWVNA